MAVASYRTRIKKSGEPTAFSSAAFTATTVNNQYQITSTAFRAWDRTQSFTFRTSATTISTTSSSGISDIDYLFGKVTFDSSQGSSLNGDGTYLPLTDVGGANTYTLSMGGDVLDDTAFNSTGWRSRTLGLRDVSLSISRWDDLNLRFVEGILDLSTAGSSGEFFAGSTVVVMEVNPGGSSSVQARGFFRISANDNSGDVGSLESVDISLELDGSTEDAFRWSDL